MQTAPRSPLSLTRFATSFLALPPELAVHILLYLSPDDLGILSRVVEPLNGVERDEYLWDVWVHQVGVFLSNGFLSNVIQTAPSRVEHALFSPLSLRPDPLELVRRGTLRGVAVVSGVRGQGYWASEPVGGGSLHSSNQPRPSASPRSTTTSLGGH